MQRITTNPNQLGFDSLLADAEEANDRYLFNKLTQHLPGNWTDALPYYCSLLDFHHAYRAR